MRYLLSLIFLVCFCLPILAQQYQYVPVTAYPAKWQVVAVLSKDDVGQLTRTCTQSNYQFMMSGADSLIAGKYWKAVSYREHRLSYTTTLSQPCQLPDVKPKVVSYPDAVTFIREDNRMLFDINFPGISLFDFNTVVGTTPPNSMMAKVDAIDTIVIDGGLRRRFHTTYTDSKGKDWVETYIEGIGNLTYGPAMVIGHERKLTCFESNGKIIYQDPDYPCGVIFPNTTPTGLPGSAEVTRPLAYPNPFTESIRIDHMPAGTTARLYNGIGQLMAEVAAGTNELQTTALPAGPYHLILKNKDGQVVHSQKLVKQ